VTSQQLILSRGFDWWRTANQLTPEDLTAAMSATRADWQHTLVRWYEGPPNKPQRQYWVGCSCLGCEAYAHRNTDATT
jgi:hypothetical protein